MLYPKKKIQINRSYYAVTVIAREDNEIHYETQSHWVGFEDPEKKVEIRKASLVRPDFMADFWRDLKTPFCVINDDKDLLIWILTGGHALISEGIAEKFLPDIIRETSCVQLGIAGFTSVCILPEAIFRKAPDPKTRMSVIKRDRYKCRICGRRPNDYVDIELHVHHIRPGGEKGLTHPKNLITLCHTCHKGLEPHYEWSLYELIDPILGKDGATKTRQEYFEGVKRYRVLMTDIFRKCRK